MSTYMKWSSIFKMSMTFCRLNGNSLNWRSYIRCARSYSTWYNNYNTRHMSYR